MPIDKFKLDTDLSQYVGCYIRFEKNQYNHISFKTEKIVAATKSELRTEKGTRIRVTWGKTEFSNGSSNCKIVGENDNYHPWTVKNIYTLEEINQQVAENKKNYVQQYQSALNLLRIQTTMFNDKLNSLYSSIDFEDKKLIEQMPIKGLAISDMTELTKKIQEFLSKI